MHYTDVPQPPFTAQMHTTGPTWNTAWMSRSRFHFDVELKHGWGETLNQTLEFRGVLRETTANFQNGTTSFLLSNIRKFRVILIEFHRN